MFLFFGIVAVAGSYYVQVEQLHVGGVRARGAGRPARRARSSSSTTSATSRPTGARASARWPCDSGRPRRARCTPRWSTAPSSPRRCPGSSASLSAWLLLPLAAPPARRAARAHRAHPHRRAVAERRARADRHAAAAVLRPARGRAAAELMDVRRRLACTLRFAEAAAHGLRRTLKARELLLLRIARRRRRRRAGARPAPLEPYDGVSTQQVRAALEAYEPILRDADGAHGRADPRRAAASSTTCPRRSPRSTSRCGTAPGAARAGRSPTCSRDDPLGAGARQRDDRRDRPRAGRRAGRARPRRRALAA